MQRLADAAAPTDVLVHRPTRSTSTWCSTASRTRACARLPELAARSVVVSSFGKTFHVTGWKVGYVAAPAALMREFRKVHQFNVFTVNTPMQHGLASFMADPAHYLGLPAFYQRKRDLLPRRARRARGCALLPSGGSYFQCVDYSALSATGRRPTFCRLADDARSASRRSRCRPSTSGGFEQRIVRFCFAKKDETLKLALERLAQL